MKPEEPSSRLIFRWHAPEVPLLRLFVWSLVGAVILAVWMLTFEVVFPRASRRSHATQHITLLDGSSPQSRQALAAVADRSFLLLAPNATGAPRLSELRPVFTPGFKDYELQVKDLPEAGAGVAVPSLPRLYGGSRSLLPSLPAAAAAARVDAPPAKVLRLVAFAAEGLGERPIVHNMEALPESSAALGEIQARFRVAVAADGRIVAAVSLMDESTVVGAAVSRELRQAIQPLRFAAAAAPGPQWGVLAFRWEEARQP